MSEYKSALRVFRFLRLRFKYYDIPKVERNVELPHWKKNIRKSHLLSFWIAARKEIEHFIKIFVVGGKIGKKTKTFKDLAKPNI